MTHLKQQKSFWFLLVLHWAMDIIKSYITSMAQWSTRRNQLIFAALDVSLNNALTVIKLLSFFVIIFAVFLPDFIFCNKVT